MCAVIDGVCRGQPQRTHRSQIFSVLFVFFVAKNHEPRITSHEFGIICAHDENDAKANEDMPVWRKGIRCLGSGLYFCILGHDIMGTVPGV